MKDQTFDEPLMPVELPHFSRPMPVDMHVIDQGPPGRPVMGPHARAHLAVYTDRGRQYRLDAYDRSAWAVRAAKYRSGLMRAAFFVGAQGADANVTSWTDEDGNAQTVRATTASDTSPTASELTTWTNTATVGHMSKQQKLKYGSGSTAPTSADTDVETQLGNDLFASAVTYDDTLFTVAISASEVYGGANDTIRELVHLVSLALSSGANVYFLADRAAPTATAVETGQTVAVSFEWQF